MVWQDQGQNFGKDRSIEADNLGSDMDRLPRSNPQIANLTIVSDDGQAILLREGTGLGLYNSVIADDSGESTCLDIDNVTTADFNGDGTVGEGHDYVGSLFACATAADAGTGEDDVSVQTHWL